MREVKISEGYKQTEVGVIPKDWEVEPLKSLLKEPPKYGINAAAVPLTGNLPVYIRITDISEDGYYSPEKVVGVNSPFSSSYILNEGDIVLARTGASVGKSYLYRKEDGTLIYAGFLIKVSPDKRLLNSKYLHQYLKTEQYWAWVIVNSMRSGQPGINGNEYGRLLIPLPSIEEQTAIATALSDVDNLIQSLEKLIAKKEAIKTGTMQQLLTGKTRLPKFATREDGSPKGFKQTELGRIPEDWDFIRLPKVAWFQEGPGVRNNQFESYGVKLLNGTNIDKGRLLLDKTERYISEKLAYGQYSHFMIDNLDILIACSGVSIDRFDEKVTIVNDKHLPLCLNTSTMRFKPNNEKLYRFYLFYFLKSSLFKKQIGGTATGSAQLNFGPFHVNKVIIFLPSTKEQTAIATILSDIDTEIQALQQRLEKTKDIKQGMMQQLLTGKVRLAH